MRGFAVIDRQAGASQIAVWIVSRSGAQASNVNAVVVDCDGDPDAMKKVWLLTRCCVVVATDGTSLDGLPIEGEPLTKADVAALLDEVDAHQARIIDAITEYKRRTRNKTLVEPTFPARPVHASFVASSDTAGQRALATANFVGKAWSAWLKTDEERRRRTEQPKTGKSPWIMPEDTNSTTVPDFPEAFAVRLHEQPVL